MRFKSFIWTGFLLVSTVGCAENSKRDSDIIDFERVDESFDVNAWKYEDETFQKIRLGRVSLSIPPPIGFIDTTDSFFGEILHDFFDQPSFTTHKIYIKKSDFDSIDDDDFADEWEDDYTLFNVRSLVMFEKTDCDSVDFAVAKKGFLSNSKELKNFKQELLSESLSSTKKALREFDLIEDDDDFKIGGIKTLPIHDSGDRHFSFIQYTKSIIGGKTTVEVTVGSLIHVKKRIFYLYGISNNTDSVGKLKYIMKDWVQKVISKN